VGKTGFFLQFEGGGGESTFLLIPKRASINNARANKSINLTQWPLTNENFNWQ